MRTTICWHKPLLHKLTPSPLHSDEGFFTDILQKLKQPLSTLFRTLPVPLAVPKTYSSFQHLFLKAETKESAHSPFFKKIFVALKFDKIKEGTFINKANEPKIHGFYSRNSGACNRCELVTLEIYFLESL